MAELAKRILKRASELIDSKEFLSRHRENPNDFTRHKKLGFIGVIAVTLGIIAKSLLLTLDDYLEELEPDIESYSKQAFSKSRAKILPSAYRELFTMSAEETFDSDAIGRHRGYRFFAIDGTDMMLPQSNAIRAKFKPVSGSRLPHARASFFYDTISGFLLDACFDTVETDERTMAFSHLETVKSRLGAKDIVLADRGYPSKELIAYCFKNGINFVMRLQKSFSPEVDASAETDFIWHMKHERETFPVRVVKIYRPDSDPRILITNLVDESLSSEDLDEFYALRWPVETRFEALKVKLEAEKFSGKTPATLEQDFYARLFLLNVEAAVKLETDKIIHEAGKVNPPKFPRKTNENILLGLLRKKLPRLLTERDDEKRGAIIDGVTKKAAKCSVQIKPGRSFARGQRSHKRTTQSKARCL
jgi:hypothetical protein